MPAIAIERCLNGGYQYMKVAKINVLGEIEDNLIKAAFVGCSGGSAGA